MFINSFCKMFFFIRFYWVMSFETIFFRKTTTKKVFVGASEIIQIQFSEVASRKIVLVLAGFAQEILVFF